MENGKYVNKLESDETLQALNWALDMMAKYKYMPEGAEWDYWKTAFPNGDGEFLVGQAYLAANEFKDMEDAYEHGMIGSISLKEFVEKADDSIFVVTNDDSGIRFENMH